MKKVKQLMKQSERSLVYLKIAQIIVDVRRAILNIVANELTSFSESNFELVRAAERSFQELSDDAESNYGTKTYEAGTVDALRMADEEEEEEGEKGGKKRKHHFPKWLADALTYEVSKVSGVVG